MSIRRVTGRKEDLELITPPDLVESAHALMLILPAPRWLRVLCRLISSLRHRMTV
jgi:hypothetical protein